ncbi:hypothetical protein, partial [Deinococcus pimensis]|uniref:hypothetical protein n=1 Tax=Deinococcus pimensis TaxID=309888 RepID=UPI0005EBC944
MTTPRSDFRPIRVIDVDLADPPHPVEGLSGHAALRCLVRLRGRPVGHVQIPVRGDAVEAWEIRDAALREAGPAVLRA